MAYIYIEIGGRKVADEVRSRLSREKKIVGGENQKKNPKGGRGEKEMRMPSRIVYRCFKI